MYICLYENQMLSFSNEDNVSILILRLMQKNKIRAYSLIEYFTKGEKLRKKAILYSALNKIRHTNFSNFYQNK